ncbi:hypothetical protein VPH35_111288 [Triticum aestivum]
MSRTSHHHQHRAISIFAAAPPLAQSLLPLLLLPSPHHAAASPLTPLVLLLLTFLLLLLVLCPWCYSSFPRPCCCSLPLCCSSLNPLVLLLHFLCSPSSSLNLAAAAPPLKTAAAPSPTFLAAVPSLFSPKLLLSYSPFACCYTLPEALSSLFCSVLVLFLSVCQLVCCNNSDYL